MAHNIFSERFYQNRTNPAWHGLGLNSPEPLTASEALERLGSYTVELVPLRVPLPDGEYMTSEYSAIVRQPTPDDQIHRVFGAPVSNYELITPQDATRIWDTNVKDSSGKTVAVETFGVLGKGERLFITVKLPSVDVRGDEVAMYMVYDNPMYSGKSAGVYTTGVRVVCQNTLTLGLSTATQRKQVSHLPGSSKEIARWLSEIYGAALMTSEVAEEAYNVLANKPARVPDIYWIADHVYPMPPEPSVHSRSRKSYDERYGAWENACEHIQRLHEAAVGLFEGSGVGMSSTACGGTMFGAYNAFAELETYRNSRQKEFAIDLVGGERAGRIRKAFNAAMTLAK